MKKETLEKVRNIAIRIMEQREKASKTELEILPNIIHKVQQTQTLQHWSEDYELKDGIEEYINYICDNEETVPDEMLKCLQTLLFTAGF